MVTWLVWLSISRPLFFLQTPPCWRSGHLPSVCVRTDHLTVHLMCDPVRLHALVNSRVCMSFLGSIFVCRCNCKRVHFACVRTSLSSTQSPNQTSPKPRRHVSRWQPNESWGRHTDSFYYRTGCNMTFDITELQLNIGCSQQPHAYTWCFVTYTLVLMTCTPEGNVFSLTLWWLPFIWNENHCCLLHAASLYFLCIIIAGYRKLLVEVRYNRVLIIFFPGHPDVENNLVALLMCKYVWVCSVPWQNHVIQPSVIQTNTKVVFNSNRDPSFPR